MFKKNYFKSVCLLLTLFCCAYGQEPFTIDGSTVGLFHFNENTSTVVFGDAYSGSSVMDGDFVGSGTTWAAGQNSQFGACVSFNGTAGSSGVDIRPVINAIDNLNGGDMTVEAWIKPTAYANESSYHSMYWGGSIAGHGGWHPYMNFYFRLRKDGKLEYSFADSTGSEALYVVIGNSVVSLNQWHHVAATRKVWYEGSGNSGVVVNLYLDGQRVGTKLFYNVNGIFQPGTDKPLLVGCYNRTDHKGGFIGQIDEVRVSKTRVYQNPSELQNLSSKLLGVLTHWLDDDPLYDLNQDGIINFIDFNLALNPEMIGDARWVLVPVIDGEPWTIATTPDLGIYNVPGQQPVDFAIWQAADGTWQVSSCIRGTAIGGKSRLLYRWEGNNLTDTNWQPKGIHMIARTDLGEIEGGLQAPHVVKQDDLYYMFYGTYEEIAKAVSSDGKTFDRVINSNGRTGIFGEGEGNGTRDPMVINIDGMWYCYYTAHPFEKGYVFVRMSPDLETWSQPIVASCGGRFGYHAVSHECPQVIEPEPGKYYLFVTQLYGSGMRSGLFMSDNPFNFGIDNDTHYVTTLPVAAPEVFEYQGQYYIAYLRGSLDGIQVAKLKWVKVDQPIAPELDFRNPNHRAQWQVVSGNLETVFINAEREMYEPWSEYFISTARKADGSIDNSKSGVIMSPAFVLNEDYYTMLMSGTWITSLYFVDATTEQTLASFSARNGEQLRPIPIPTEELGIKGKSIRIKLVDSGDDHVNFGGLWRDIKYDDVVNMK